MTSAIHLPLISPPAAISLLPSPATTTSITSTTIDATPSPPSTLKVNINHEATLTILQNYDSSLISCFTGQPQSSISQFGPVKGLS
ncbi:hypothetical protein Pcinc_021735 [Petrolisthes cinctipes]|uniref:Uncharacterized protein n=1 Tax=Petrolisthes cinctipes TaxID=88211 RepID=A0AAE1KH19_PETCI|nr:hypothetical protein Pcinc_021735 [Petrolisthes cinctipes]